MIMYWLGGSELHFRGRPREKAIGDTLVKPLFKCLNLSDQRRLLILSTNRYLIMA
jgi:hypothetical protein